MTESFKKKIPDNMHPWECEVNGVKYVYPAGTEQNVPEEVAVIIDAYWASRETEFPNTAISFNDLKDRPFYEETEVLFDQRVEMTQFAYVHSEELPISAGDVVKVTWNGMEYECTASLVSQGGMTAVIVGNEFGEGREPFAIAIGADFGGTMMMDATGTLTEADIRISKSVVKTLDPKFLPGGGGGKVIYYYDYDADTVTDANGNEITVEQAQKDMFNVVIRDLRHDDVFQIPIKITSGDGYVCFDWYSYDGGERVVIGERPK